MIQPIMQHGARVLRKLISLAVRNAMGTVTGVATAEPLVALTFDDGPHPDYTPRLLDTLERHRARATFFMVGAAAQRYPEIVRRVAQAGHAIGNHSWDHPSFPLISSRERRIQIRACAKVIAPYTNGVRLFRAPYGDQNLASRLDALLLGYQDIMFNIATDDWCGGDGATIADQIERRIKPGSVIILHDRLFDALEKSYFDRQGVLDAVQILLQRMGERFRFVTVPELLRHGNPQREIWCKQTDPDLLNQLEGSMASGRRYTKNGKNNRLVNLRNRLLEIELR